MFAQHVPFDLPDFVPVFTFFFFPTFAPVELKGRNKVGFSFAIVDHCLQLQHTITAFKELACFLSMCQCYLNFFQNPSCA